MIDHDRRVAIVTGAGRGIGAGIARCLSRDGATVICADIALDAASATARSCANQAYGALVDVASRQSCDDLVAEVSARYGTIAIMVNNAGINRDAMLHKMTDEQWGAVIDVDLSGPFFLTRAVAQRMREKRFGRIVNVSSASWFGNIGQANYAAAKAGVIGLSRTASKELARFNVTVNALCPGFIETEMTKALPGDIFDAQLRKIPLGRIGKPEDVGNLVSFLASDEGGYITGEIINIGGGYQI